MLMKKHFDKPIKKRILSFEEENSIKNVTIMKVGKTTRIALLLLGFAMVVVACEPKPAEGGSGKTKNRSEVEKMLDKLIDSLKRETDWQTSQLLFSRIESSIESDELRIRDKDKADFHKDSQDAYCYSMDNIMHIMMTGTCGDHKKLEEIWNLRTGKEYGSVKSSLYEEVKQLHKDHQGMLTFISDCKKNRQTVTNFDTKYDFEYETGQGKKASGYLKTTKCKTIVADLEKIQKGTAFASRRIAFCQKVVDLYLEKDSWVQGDENLVISRIKFYTKEHPNDAKVIEWNAAIEDFKTAHQSN